MMACPQHAFGSCPGSTCDRNCSERMFLTAFEIVERQTQHQYRTLKYWTIALIISVSIAGVLGAKIAMERQEHAYKMEARI